MNLALTLHKTLLKQSSPRLWLGGVRDMIQRAQSYYGLCNVFIALATLYTVRQATIHQYFPWADFGKILGILALGIVILVIVDYKVIYPSQIAFHQHEAYKHRSLIKKDMAVANKRQEKMARRLAIIEKTIMRIERKLDERGLPGTA